MFQTSGGFAAVGDIENNFKKLSRVLLKVHYPELFARERVLAGESAVFVPMLRYALTAMSHKLSRHLLNHGYEIYSPSDAKFVEAAYKVCIHALHYYPVLTQIQFCNPPKGYAERKIVQVTAIIECCLRKHQELARDQKGEATRTTSEKKKQREVAQARLTQAPKQSDELVQEEAGPAAAARGRRSSRDELNSSRSASTTASTSSRARSVSRARAPVSASQKKKSSRPSTAHGLDNSTSTNSSFVTPATSAASFYHPASQVTITGMPDNARERAMAPNGELVDMYRADRDEHRAAMEAYHGQQSAQPSPVKKAWMHEHGGGSVNVSVMGMMADASPQNRGHDESLSQSRGNRADYTRAQDLDALRRREDAQQQAEADRVRMLQIQHQQYASQNSPHVEHEEGRYYDEQHGLYEDELPRPPYFGATQGGQQGHQSQAAQLSASMRSSFAASSSPTHSPSRHTVGDEQGLNASFGLTEEPTVQVNQGGGRPSDLAQLSDQLNHIANRNSRVAQKAAGSARKQQAGRGVASAASSFNGAASVQRREQAAPTPAAVAAASATPDVAALLSSVPRPSTALESQLFALLETISAKMTVMQSDMSTMEAKMERMAQANASAPAAAAALNGATSNASYSSHAAPSHQFGGHAHPLPLSSAQPRGSDPALVPHPSHAYTPSTSYFGAPRGDNVNRLGQPTQSLQPPQAARSRHASPQRHSAAGSSVPTVSPQRGALGQSSMVHASPARRSGYAAAQREHEHELVQRERERVHGQSFAAPSSAAASMYANIPVAHVAPSSAASASFSASAHSGPFTYSSATPSALHTGHPVSGSAALAQDSVIPSTDQFIEQLKARVRQTNELLGTARMTQRAHEAASHAQQ